MKITRHPTVALSPLAIPESSVAPLVCVARRPSATIIKTTYRLTGSVLALAAFNLLAATLYVSLESRNPVPPYARWETAANTIQDAVDLASDGDSVLVTNGVYSVSEGIPGDGKGGVVVVTNSIRLESVNGPLVTVIKGNSLFSQDGFPTNGLRCVVLGTNSVLSGFTLTNGWSFGVGSSSEGGGVYCESQSAVVSNCIIVGNTAQGGGGAYGGTLINCTLSANVADWGGGGGAYLSTLYNCVITDNSATSGDTLGSGFGGGVSGCTLYNCSVKSNFAGKGGGGAGWSTLYNCTLTGNSARWGGGAWSGALTNCIVYFNTASDGPDNYGGAFLDHCITTPIPASGVGNLDANPLFVDAANGDFRLQLGSPCIDAGTNLTELSANDILGLPRVMDGNGNGIVRVDMGAYEFNPYRFEPALELSSNGFRFTIQGEPNKSVRIERSLNLVDWEEVANVPIPASGQTVVDPAATAERFLFYRALSVP